MIDIMLVDDHPVVRDGYKQRVDQTPDIRVVAEASSGEEACQLYLTVRPDVVVLDLNMPGMGGLETIHRLISREPGARILVFSMHDSMILISRALEAGAAGYLSKSSAASEMLQAIRMVAEGKCFIDKQLAPILMQQQLGENDPLKMLTQREFEIFQYLAEGHPVTEIAKLLSISPKTVGVHQTNIMKKMNLRNLSELTRLAIRSGVIQS